MPTEDEKIRALAGWARSYRAGVAEMVKQGADPDELNRAIYAAEERAEAEQAAVLERRRRAARRAAIRKSVKF